MRSPPRRTCIGCGEATDPLALVRLKLDGANVIVDAKRTGGRGAWIHPGADCLAKAIRRRAFARAFRRSDVACDGSALRERLTGNARKD